MAILGGGAVFNGRGAPVIIGYDKVDYHFDHQFDHVTLTTTLVPVVAALLTDYWQVDILGVWYKSVNSGRADPHAGEMDLVVVLEVVVMILGHLADKNPPPPGSLQWHTPRAIWCSQWGGAISYKRGTPIC